MKKIIITFLVALSTSLVSVAQKKCTEWQYSPDDVAADMLDIINDESGRFPFQLIEWGWLNNDYSAHDMTQSEQVWYFLGDTMMHFNTDDGDFRYDMTVEGNTIHLSNQMKADDQGWKPTDTPFVHKMQLVATDDKSGLIIVITDDMGIYRIFKPYVRK